MRSKKSSLGSVPVLSIILPCHNASGFIINCIESIICLHSGEFELIVVDDGSTDSSGRILTKYAKADKRIKLIFQENAGVSSARNTGLKYASGKYVMFVDADDYIIDMTSAYDIVSNITEDIGLASFEILYENRPHKSTYPQGKYTISTLTEYIASQMLTEDLNSPCNKIYRLDIIKKYDLHFDPTIKIGEDLLFNGQYISHCKKVYHYGQKLYFYRTSNQSSATKYYFPDKYRQLIHVNNRLRTALEEKLGTRIGGALDYIQVKNTLSCIQDLHRPECEMSRVDKIDRISIYKQPKKLTVPSGLSTQSIVVWLYNQLNETQLYVATKLVYLLRKR